MCFNGGFEHGVLCEAIQTGGAEISLDHLFVGGLEAGEVVGGTGTKDIPGGLKAGGLGF